MSSIFVSSDFDYKTPHSLTAPADGTYLFTNGSEQQIVSLQAGEAINFKLDGKAQLMRLDSGFGIESGSIEEPEEIRPSIEQCSICAKKFDLPKDLKGPQRLIPVHTELFTTRCDGSGKPPKK